MATVTIYAQDTDKDPYEIIDGAFHLCTEYENKLSRTIEGSEIDQINHSQGTPVTVSPDTAELISEALKYGALSEGSFDIAIAPLSSLWDFKAENPQVPDSSAIAEAVKHVDYRNIRLEGNTVTLTDPDCALDLGAIAKGFIADKIAAYLKEQGVTSAMINLGGNVLAVGSRPDGTDFNVGIQKPFENQNVVLGVFTLSGKSVVTSGIYERFFRKDGKLYHHILNPDTGYPIENSLLSVTIISDTSTEGDALSTTCFILGLEKGMALIESLDNVEAIFVTDDMQEHYSSGIGSKVKFKAMEE